MVKLKDSLSCITYNGAQHTHIQITEEGVSAKLKKVTLIAPNGDWLSFDPDSGRKCKRIHHPCNAVVMSPLLVIGDHDHHCACDCVVAVNRGGQLTVLYVDLKSSNTAGYAKQFKSTRQFVRYALGLLEEFHGEKLSIADERYVILHIGKGPLLNKKPTIPKKVAAARKSQPNDADKREVSNAGRLYLKELLGWQ